MMGQYGPTMYGGNPYGAPQYAPMGGGSPSGTGYQYHGAPLQKHGNTLGNDEIQKLVKKENVFSLQITETEKLRAICNHRAADGMSDTLVEGPDGLCTCQICGYRFLPLDASMSSLDQVEEATDNLLDILQTIKLIYIDMPELAAREYFQIIALIDKIPKLYELAIKDYAQHERVDPYAYNNRGMGALNLFNMLIGGQRPMNFGQPDQSNGFGYYGASEGYQASTDPNFAYRPQPPVEPVAPAGQPSTAVATTDGKDTSVNVSFKS